MPDHGFGRSDGHHKMVDFRFQPVRPTAHELQSPLGNGGLWLHEIEHDGFCRTMEDRTCPCPSFPIWQFSRGSSPLFRLATYQAGETVLSAASTTGRLLILKEGAVAVVKEGVEIARVTEPGAVFGELSVLLDQPHTADVRALEASQFHIADAATILRVDPIALLYVATVLAQRLDSANRALLELKRQVQANEPRSVIGRTVEKIEGLLGTTGANLMYAGYPYDPFADAPRS